MSDRKPGLVFDQRVEIGDAYLGGEKPGRRGRGSTNKVPFLAAVETSDDGRPLRVKFTVMPFRKEAVRDWANQHLTPPAYVVSDALPSVRAGMAAEHVPHQAIRTWSGRQAVKYPELRWVNMLLGNLKTSITGTCRAFKFHKYAPRYLAEVQYRFNRQFDLPAMLPRLLRASAITRPFSQPAIRLTELRC